MPTTGSSPPHTPDDAVRHEPSEWLSAAAALLEEVHVFAWTANAPLRERFGLEMTWYLERLAQSQTLVLHGSDIKDLDGFCRQLEHAMPHAGRLERDIEGKHGVMEAVRRRPSESVLLGSAGLVKHRYFVWRDADTLLAADRALFGRLVDALAGVAAESEYASEDRLLIQRSLFIGGPALAQYGEDPEGQFRRWLSDGLGEPFWSTVSGIKAPAVRGFEVR
ncbi:MAG: hypothetical protein ACKVS8_08960 [Phycisphaerales bacterium]